MKKIVIFVVFFFVHVAYADFTNNLPPFVMRDGLQYDLVVENGDSIFGAWNYPSFYYFQNNLWVFAVVYERLPLGFPGNFATGDGRDCVAFVKSTNGAYDWMYFLGWNGQYCGSNNEGTNSLGITWGTVGTWTNFVYVAPATNGSWEAVISNGVAGGNSQLVIILSNAAPDWAASASGIGSLVNALGGTGTTSAANMLKVIDDRFTDANSSEYFQQWDDDFYSRVTFDNDRLKTTLGGDVVNVQQYGNWTMTVNGMDDYLTGSTFISKMDILWQSFVEYMNAIWQWTFKDSRSASVFKDSEGLSVFVDENGVSRFKQGVANTNGLEQITESEKDNGIALAATNHMEKAEDMVDDVDALADAGQATSVYCSELTSTVLGKMGLSALILNLQPYESIKIWTFEKWGQNNQDVDLTVDLTGSMFSGFRTVLSFLGSVGIVWVMSKWVMSATVT